MSIRCDSDLDVDWTSSFVSDISCSLDVNFIVFVFHVGYEFHVVYIYELVLLARRLHAQITIYHIR